MAVVMGVGFNGSPILYKNRHRDITGYGEYNNARNYQHDGADEYVFDSKHADGTRHSDDCPCSPLRHKSLGTEYPFDHGYAENKHSDSHGEPTGGCHAPPLCPAYPAAAHCGRRWGRLVF